jgi:hypothetical protein
MPSEWYKNHHKEVERHIEELEYRIECDKSLLEMEKVKSD